MIQIRRLREARGWTQAQLAAAAGLSQPTISGIEAGSATTTSTLEAIADALGCQVIDLWRVPDGLA